MGWLFGILVLLALVVYYYLPATEYLYLVRNEAKNRPELWQVPQSLPLENHGPTMGKQISFRGVTFLTSWGDAKLVREFPKGGLLTFGESRSVLFFLIAEPAVNYRTLTLNYDKNGALRRLTGEPAMKSNFDLEREVLNSSPRDLVFSFNRTRMIHQTMFVSAKLVDAARGQTGIYEFRTDRVRGFQKGNPEKTDSVVLDVYDSNDRLTTIILGKWKNATTFLTQAEINTFIESLDIDQDAGAPKAAGK